MAGHELDRLFDVLAGLDADEVAGVDVPDDVAPGSAPSATTLVVMSRSVITPTSVSSSVMGSDPMSSSRISRAASTTEADVPIERGFSVITSRTVCAIVPPLSLSAILTRLDQGLTGCRRLEPRAGGLE